MVTITSINDYAIYVKIDGFDIDGFLHSNDLTYDKKPEEELKKYKKDQKIKVKILEIKPEQQKVKSWSQTNTRIHLIGLKTKK